MIVHHVAEEFPDLVILRDEAAGDIRGKITAIPCEVQPDDGSHHEEHEEHEGVQDGL